jgi:hypothetical protein
MSCSPEQITMRTGGNPSYVPINLYYVGSLPMDIRGPVTGFRYHFSPLQPVQSVDPRDAIDLLVDRQFRLAQ